MTIRLLVSLSRKRASTFLILLDVRFILFTVLMIDFCSVELLCNSKCPAHSLRNREAMWQETRMNLQTGAYGNPQELDTLILFWSHMEALFYPSAAEAKRYLEEKLQQQQAMMAEQQQIIQQQIMAQQRAQMERDDRARRLDQISQRAAAHIHKLGKDMPTTAWADEGK